MPSTSKAQRTAARIAEGIKSGRVPAKPGTPSAKMAQMPKKSLDEFAKGPIAKKKKAKR